MSRCINERVQGDKLDDAYMRKSVNISVQPEVTSYLQTVYVCICNLTSIVMFFEHITPMRVVTLPA